MGQVQPSTPVIVVDTSDAWGYHSPKDFGDSKENATFRNFIYLHDGLNAASIVLSPLAGIIRIITAVYLMVKIGKMEQFESSLDLDATKRFYKMQAVRGVLEILGLGIILGTVVDGIMTCKHKGYFDKAEEL